MRLPDDRYVVVDSHRVRYWDAGSGPGLLLLHGLGSSALVWHRSMAGLSEWGRVIALDLPGHGLSDMPRQNFRLPEAAAFVARFMQGLCEGPFVVVGNSVGGAIAMEVALSFPDQVRAVVLVDSAGLGREIAWWLRLLSIPGIGEYIERPSPQRMCRIVQALVYDPSGVEDEFLLEMYRYRARPEASRWLLRFLRTGVSVWGQRPQVQRLDRLSHLGTPVLILWGRQDRLVPVAHAVRAAARCRRAALEVFDRCGHWPQLEHPEQFVDAVTRFLCQHVASGNPPGVQAGSQHRSEPKQ